MAPSISSSSSTSTSSCCGLGKAPTMRERVWCGNTPDGEDWVDRRV